MERLAPFQHVMIQGVSDLAAAELWVVCKATLWLPDTCHLQGNRFFPVARRFLLYT